MTINMDPARQNMKTVPARILRRSMTRTGTVAVSGIKYWTEAKARNRMANMTINTMMRQLVHAYVEPPHCKARMRQDTLGTKKKTPRGSSLTNCSHMDTGAGVSQRGKCRMKMRHSAAKPPIGRLM